MKSKYLLGDFGSTWTKLTAVDCAAEEIVGTAAAYTTIETGIEHGLAEAKDLLLSAHPEFAEAEFRACSSAAGGLRMMVAGLVPELTGEAARLAALGAGAKVIGVYSHELTEEDGEEIMANHPEIFLLTGGTDGGNKACIINNAEVLASLKPSFPIVLAGNRSAVKEVKEILRDCEYHVCPNVMPRLGEIEITKVQEKIREIFLNEIIQAKGLSKIQSMLDNILLPTPSAIMKAMELLSMGTENEPGIGELLAVDLGGATTDVYSIADGSPSAMNTVLKGIPEPHAKRTVEGDLGMRYSLQGIIDAAGLLRLEELSGIKRERIMELTTDLRAHTDRLPETKELLALDEALAKAAIEIAVRRHAGSLEEVYTPVGKVYAQAGKDLRDVNKLVVTGGAIVRVEKAAEIASYCFYDFNEPNSLKPREADILVDRKYILSAMGVLAQSEPEHALRIMKKELSHE
ncbi:MAG: methylaspartate mutase accessory protein GlmL [Eubacteriales bacterium]|nr:methylaspartate mutase accessory protein GlmL [Eubacteriales bacterium]